METLTCGSTEILIGGGASSALPRDASTRNAVVTQPGARAIAEAIARRLNAPLMVVPDREAAKTLATADRVYRWLDETGLDRQDRIVAVGGGTVSDLAGFVASTYLRGVRCAIVPTTLLAAVDAAIGGKTGLNLDAKNLVGTFWEPEAVLVDIDVLRRLPAALLREGMAEIAKAALIGDPELVQVLEQDGAGSPLDAIVPSAIKVKVEVVNSDPKEGGRRAVLNYGHTAGHAIERVASLPHGEAVSIGMTVAAAVSERLVGFDEAVRQRMLLKQLGLPTTTDLPIDPVVELMRHDKKRRHGELRMVLLERIGSPAVVAVDDTMVRSALSDTLAEEVP